MRIEIIFWDAIPNIRLELVTVLEYNINDRVHPKLIVEGYRGDNYVRYEYKLEDIESIDFGAGIHRTR